jgi:hypothetical protein
MSLSLRRAHGHTIIQLTIHPPKKHRRRRKEGEREKKKKGKKDCW